MGAGGERGCIGVARGGGCKRGRVGGREGGREAGRLG